ncbi:MAG TPA: hypothetical protein VGI10_29695 [Polyangiaceae bacterium]|jgi:hypothetical protein
MIRSCEVCAGKKSGARVHKAHKLRRVLIEDRLVALCDAHADYVQKHDPSNVAELRALFRERRGKRSAVGRRTPVDRRVFPARPEGRRAKSGRRATDRA